MIQLKTFRISTSLNGLLGDMRLMDSSQEMSCEPTIVGMEMAVEKMHPLVAAALHNLTQSQLCSLPEDILLLIMDYTDEISLFCLRRTSRVFMRLFGDRRFRKHHDDTREPRNNPWKLAKLSKQTREAIERLVCKDVYCKTCRTREAIARREKLRYTYLHCSGCMAKHPAGLFSDEQRNGPQKSRICIGREGNVRICDHKVLTWSMIEEWMASPKQTKLIQCNHRAHRDRYNHHGEWKSPEIELTKDFKSAKLRQEAQPTAILRWSTHVELPGFGMSGGVEAADLSRLVDSLRQNEGQYIIPATLRPHPYEALPFDPNFCTCIRYPGSRKFDWQLSEREPPTYSGCCQRHFQERQINMAMLDFTGIFWHYGRKDCRYGSGHFRGTVSQCQTSPECLEVRYQREIPLVPCRHHHKKTDWGRNEVRPSLPSWYMALDPESYNIRQDKEALGTYWCLEKSCHHYWRYHCGNIPRIMLQNPDGYAERRGLRGVLYRLQLMFFRR
jgi:hypothetical protein